MLYSDEMLVRREALRSSRIVVDALRNAWEVCKSAAAPLGCERFPREAYFTMARKIYLVTKLSSGKRDFDAQECIKNVSRDFTNDSSGSEVSTQRPPPPPPPALPAPTLPAPRSPLPCSVLTSIEALA